MVEAPELPAGDVVALLGGGRVSVDLHKCSTGEVVFEKVQPLMGPYRPDKGHQKWERDIKSGNLHKSRCDSRKHADENEWPKRQVSVAADSAHGQQRRAVDGGQGECGKGAGEQCLPASPARRGTDARSDLGVTQAHGTGQTTDRPK